MSVQAIRWDDTAQQLQLLDQRLLPSQEVYLKLDSAPEVADAIRDLVVRGAPAIGISAAYGVVLSLLRHRDSPQWRSAVEQDMRTLAGARPTAVNLFWALRRMRETMADWNHPEPERALSVARALHAEDVEANRRMGELGAELIDARSSVLTHCNTGSLATGGYGTALGVIRSAWEAGKLEAVYASETRPWLQGARLTAWELMRDQIPAQLVIEGAVASLFAQGRAHWLIVGADRICANGDTANKIGTYGAAVLARQHGAKVMVVAPTTTVDMETASGDEVEIEIRTGDELTRLGEASIAAAGTSVWNPVFDITPAQFVDYIVTEKGVARPPFDQSLARLMSG